MPKNDIAGTRRVMSIAGLRDTATTAGSGNRGAAVRSACKSCT
jgi:hypothetical protein